MGFLDTSARIRASIMEKLPTLPDNFRPTLAQGVADFAIGETFCSAETGSTRRYERIASAPGYEDMGDGAAPPTRANVVSTDALQALSNAQRSTARTNIGAVDKASIPSYSTRVAVIAMIVPASVDQFTTAGCNQPGDQGGAAFKRVALEPTHPGKLQDAGGAWFLQVGPEFRPQQWGYFPGDADATVGIQAALDTTKAIGNGWTRLSAGKWYAGDVIHPSGVEAFGDGETKTFVLRRDGAALVRGVWALQLQASNIRLDGMTLDAQSSSENLPILSLGDLRDNVRVGARNRVTLINGMNRWAIRADQTDIYTRLRLLVHVENCPLGGILILPAKKGNRWIDLSFSTFRRCGHNIVSIYDINDPVAGRWDSNFDVNLDNIQITECLNTGAYGPIPVEAWGCTRLTQRNFLIDSGTRGATAGAHMTDGIIGPGKIMNQTAYAMEAGNSRRCVVRAIEAVNCASLVHWTGESALPGPNLYVPEIRDFLMEDVTLIGTGRTFYDLGAGPDAVKIDGGKFYGVVFRRVRILDPVYMRSGFRINVDAGSSITLEDCEVISRVANTAVKAFTFGGNGDVTVRRPKARILVDLSSAHYQSGDGTQIALPQYTSASQGSFTLQDPFCEMAGAVGSFANLMAIGRNAAPSPLFGLSITNVRLKGAYPASPSAITLPDSSGTAQLLGVDATAMTSGTPTNLNGSIMARRTGTIIEGTAAPTTGTWRTGAIVEHSAPSATSPVRWQCIAGGSPGMWQARYSAGSDPYLPATYASLATIATSGRLVAVQQPGYVNTVKLRCDVVAAGQPQPDMSFQLTWSGRFNNKPRRGVVVIAFGSYDTPTVVPEFESTTLGNVAANAATVTLGTDTSGRSEVTITFPSTSNGVAVTLSAQAGRIANYASYSAAAFY